MNTKYHSTAFENAQGKWDSRNEYRRYCYLNSLQEEGKITDLRRQVEYELIPRQTVKVTEVLKTKTVEKERFAEHPVTYVADFVYKKKGADGELSEVVEDFKGMRTKDYVIKRKLMLFRYGIRIKEVTRPGELI